MKIKYVKKIFIGFLILVFLGTGCSKQNYTTHNENYDWFIEYLELTEVWDRSITGKGVTIAVIDSGIDYNLLGEEFDKTRILAEFNAIDDSNNVNDYTSHGSAMVNLIGASGNDLFGVAPDCNFVIIKALDSLGSTNSTTLEKAIRFAIDYGVDVINLSVGGGVENEGITEAIQLATEANIIVVCSVGDYGREGAIFPANLNNCLGVAAIDHTGELYQKSNYGLGVDIYLPGVKIKAAKYNYAGDVVYSERSGSSVATAIATGIVTLYVESHKQYTVNEVYSKFRETEVENLKSILLEDIL